MVLKRTFSFNEETISALFFSVFFGSLLGRAAVDLFNQGARSCPEMFFLCVNIRSGTDFTSYSIKTLLRVIHLTAVPLLSFLLDSTRYNFSAFLPKRGLG